MNHYVSDPKQPIFLSFEQILQNHETDLDFDLFIKKFQENYEKEQQENWLKFWNKQGEEYVLQAWNEKYRSYLQQGIDSDLCITKECEILKTSESNILLQEKSWEELWHEHTEKIYYEQYLIFTTIHYKYFLDLKKAFESSQPISEEQEEIQLDTEESVHDLQTDSLKLSQELEQLKILGLPTSFEGRPQNSSKKSKGNKKPAIHYSDFFSDSEMESDEEEHNDSQLSFEIKDHEDSFGSVHRQKSLSKVQKRKRNRKLKNVPSFILEEKGLLKYWRKRFSLFSRFDEGIRLDRESWFSVTPEKVAKHLAQRLKSSIIVDGFCGSGGNVIQFALSCDKVIAIDIDPIKLEMAKHNAAIYKVSHKIEFILGDFMQLSLSGKLKSDIVFLSPPWGGPKYKNKKEYDIEKYLLPVKASELVEAARNVSQNIALFLPRNSNIKQIVKLAGIGNRCEIEHNYLDSRLVAITALYGEEILNKNETNCKSIS